MGRMIHKRVSIWNVFGVALSSSILFFVITNFAAFLSGMYPISWTGLVSCYVAAIPFFQNTVASNLIFSGLLFGGFALIEKKFLQPVVIA